MSDNTGLISQFSDVTGADPDRAKFFLELAAWQLEVALANYYENDGEERDAEIQPQEAFQDAIAPPEPSVKTDGRTKEPHPKTKQNAKFATIASLNKDGSSDEEEGQAFFAGGSEHSGQQILGPGKNKPNIVAEMFRTAQEHGADVIDPNSASSSRRENKFGGTGYRLGQSSNDTEVLKPSTKNEGVKTNEEYIITLKMWRDGFSINDGPLRRYSEPTNKEFLDTVASGEVPDELLDDARGREVHLSMEDHSHDEFVLVKPKLKPFTGKGNVLGSPAPNTVSTPTSTTAITDIDKNKLETKAKEELRLDTNRPTTTIQIRLADGSRLVGTFNHTHTVADVRHYITLSRPEYDNRSFSLLTTFPSKTLENNNQTLSDAGLLNSAILQRLT